MKKEIICFFCISLLLVFFIVSVSSAQNYANDEDLEKRIEFLEDRLKKFEDEMEARKALSPDEEEEIKKTEEALKAAQGDYVLLKKDKLELDYGFSYSYNSLDTITDNDSFTFIYDKTINDYNQDLLYTTKEVQHSRLHTVANTISVNYGVRDNINFGLSFPFIYKYDKTLDRELNDIGDITLSLRWQPIRVKGKLPNIILYGNFKTKTGRSPFVIDLDKELATGSGYYSMSGGMSFSKAVDPVAVFGGCTYIYGFEVDSLNQHLNSGRTLEKVDPGSSVGFNLGFAYALSYDVSFNIQFQQGYSFQSNYWINGEKISSTEGNTASLSVGTGFRITPKTTLSLNFGFGLTSNTNDYFISMSIPFVFSDVLADSLGNIF